MPPEHGGDSAQFEAMRRGFRGLTPVPTRRWCRSRTQCRIESVHEKHGADRHLCVTRVSYLWPGMASQTLPSTARSNPRLGQPQAEGQVMSLLLDFVDYERCQHGGVAHDHHAWVVQALRPPGQDTAGGPFDVLI